MSNIEVLLSCMNQDCENIVFRSNLNNVRTLVVNQCDVVQDDLIEYNDKLRCINTGSRGLSRSRNMSWRILHHRMLQVIPILVAS